METSDSEYFESADEEFDGEETSSVSHPKITPTDKVVNSLQELSVDGAKSEHVKDISSTSNERPASAKTRSQINAKVHRSERKISSDDENVKSADKRPVPKAVSKLGVRVKGQSDKDKARSVEKSQGDRKSVTKLDDTSWGWNDDTPSSGGERVQDDLNSKLPECINVDPTAKKAQKQVEVTEDGDGWDWDEDVDVDDQPVAGTQSNAGDWEEDSWEPVENKPLEVSERDTKWSSWGNWGVTSLLSTATAGLNTVTTHVSQVLENGMGVPDPEALARQHKTQAEKSDRPERAGSGFGLGSWVSGVNQITKLVETTGNKVIAGGLDTLETIGKKTMEVLQEGDPGLKKKRAFLHIDSNKPILSQILREAKEKAETENKMLTEKHFHKKANYESLFDDHQGLVHLEALEMLSRQCDIKLQTILETLSGKELFDMQETLEQIKELCELPEEDEEKTVDNEELDESLSNAITEMNIPLTFQKLMSTWLESEQWLSDLKLELINELELHEQSINILAQLTAIAVENFHKIGELLLVKSHRSTVDEADSLVQLTTLLTTLISHAAKKLSDRLNEKGVQSKSGERTSEFITNVYYEAANSSSYIQNSFQLLLPILQVGVL